MGGAMLGGMGRGHLGQRLRGREEPRSGWEHGKGPGMARRREIGRQEPCVRILASSSRAGRGQGALMGQDGPHSRVSQAWCCWCFGPAVGGGGASCVCRSIWVSTHQIASPPPPRLQSPTAWVPILMPPLSVCDPPPRQQILSLCSPVSGVTIVRFSNPNLFFF